MQCRWFAVLLVFPSFAQTPVVKYATRLAGSGNDSVAGLVLDPSSNTWIAGSTTSLDFPVVNAKQSKPAATSFLRVEGSAYSWSYNTSLKQVIAMAASRTIAGVVYASDPSEVHKSTDGGDSWTLLVTQPALQPLSSLNIFTALAVDPKNALTIYAGGAALSKSTDGGAS